LLAPPVTWVCGRCNLRETRRDPIPEQRFHHCSGMAGLTMPMVREGEKVNVIANKREDYVGHEDVPLVDGVPYMNVTTEHADGHTDVCVFAPTAYGSGRASA
jgi:hypothetical protein